MEALVLIVVLLFSIVVHEVAHAWQARREGDHLAESLGRITLNPIPHIDPFGSVLVPLISHFGTGILFGWAKPVPVNPSQYRSPVWSDIRVSMAGIVSNIGLAVLATLGWLLLAKLPFATGMLGAVVDLGIFAMQYGVLINLLLAFLNLIPLPPLDGSHVVFHILPHRLAVQYREFGQYGIPVLMGLILVPALLSRVGISFHVPFLTDALGFVLSPVFYFFGLADSFIRLWI
jgi:Zn-dependent protease